MFVWTDTNISQQELRDQEADLQQFTSHIVTAHTHRLASQIQTTAGRCHEIDLPPMPDHPPFANRAK